jgi:hypothetical protein
MFSECVRACPNGIGVYFLFTHFFHIFFANNKMLRSIAIKCSREFDIRLVEIKNNFVWFRGFYYLDEVSQFRTGREKF